ASAASSTTPSTWTSGISPIGTGRRSHGRESWGGRRDFQTPPRPIQCASTTRPRTLPPVFRSVRDSVARSALRLSMGIGASLPARPSSSSSFRSWSVPTYEPSIVIILSERYAMRRSVVGPDSGQRFVEDRGELADDRLDREDLVELPGERGARSEGD